MPAGYVALVRNGNRLLRAAISIGERPNTTHSAAFSTAEPPCQKASFSPLSNCLICSGGVPLTIVVPAISIAPESNLQPDIERTASHARAIEGSHRCDALRCQSGGDKGCFAGQARVRPHVFAHEVFSSVLKIKKIREDFFKRTYR